MHRDFAEINGYVYWSLHGAFLDALIWCLGPFVDDSREYGVLRLYLAHGTRKVVLRWIRPSG